MHKAIQFINSLKINDETVVLACSYGPDSMVLFHLLEELRINFIAAHVNHQLRKESAAEYQRLEMYCQKRGIIFEGMVITEYPKGNVEQNARDLRYDFFRKILKKYNAKYLFTAHHGDDLVETVLMRLVRGSSFKGYAGFCKLTKYDSYIVARPLIFYTKEELLNYGKTNNLEYTLDASNNLDIYARNRIRHHVLPKLKEENKNVHHKFLKFSEMISEYEEYTSFKTKQLLKSGIYQNNHLNLKQFLELEVLWQKNILQQILLEIYADRINRINDEHVESILRLAISSQNTYIVLPNNLNVAKFYQMLIFDYHKNPRNSYNFELKKEVRVPLGKIIRLDHCDIAKSNYLIRLNSQELCLPLYVRTRKIGDRMSVKNLKGTKKINDIFIDHKVPGNIRDIYPILVDSNDKILWIPGIKKSKNDKLKTEKYDIMFSYIQKGEKDEK